MSRHNKALGNAGEALAAQVLTEAGYTILCTNYRCVYGEVDIVAFRDGVIAFVEVKTRLGTSFGEGRDAVGSDKRRRIRNCARFFLQDEELLRQGIALPEYQFVDFQVIDIGVTHLDGLVF